MAPHAQLFLHSECAPLIKRCLEQVQGKLEGVTRWQLLAIMHAKPSALHAKRLEDVMYCGGQFLGCSWLSLTFPARPCRVASASALTFSAPSACLRSGALWLQARNQHAIGKSSEQQQIALKDEIAGLRRDIARLSTQLSQVK